MRKQGFVAVGIVLVCLGAMAETPVTGARRYTEAKLGLTVVAGDVELPSEGGWTLADSDKDSGLYQIQLDRGPGARGGPRGTRVERADTLRRIEQERGPLWSLYWACTEYAKAHNGVGPDSWEALSTHAVRQLGAAGFAQASSNFFLIPGVPIQGAGGQAANRGPLALQLHPCVADGKHWVLYSDNRMERVAVDLALCAKHGVTIQPLAAAETPPPAPSAATTSYVVSALVKPGTSPGVTRLTLRNEPSNARMDCTWDWRSATDGDRSALSAWAESRARRWGLLAAGGDAPVLRYWLSRGRSLYGTSDFAGETAMPGRRGETTDAFSVLGGRAAVRETLQMQPIRPGAAAPAEPTIPIEQVTGVQVKSHPFEDMLKSVKAGEWALADNVPADRAFVFFPKPEKLLALLEEGAEFVFQGGSLAVANSAAYDLKSRYVERLALTDQWVRDLLIKSGAVKEMAVFSPDLFFIDGTEVTVLARIPSAKSLGPALGLLGLSGLSSAIVEKDGRAGKSYWVMDGDLLVIGTSRGEIERVLALRKAGGVGSLGRSAEFRYMLAVTPVRPETRAYGYLSDPFIRRLVGPEVKIGQLRRLVAKGEMEGLTAAAMLYRMDGHAGQSDVPGLLAKGYLAAEPTVARGSVLDERLVASCPTYGSPARLKTLLENPVRMVTPAESSAYSGYLENYSRFWRQYFDPIAFRLDDGPAGELQLTTFILPLIDNSIYNGLKEVLQHKEHGSPLRIPDLTPKPLLLLSANLSEASWTKATSEMFSDLLRRYTTLDPAAFDKIGPGIHMAIHDADPIITFGAGDALGLFGAPTMRGGQMLFIPAIASILTRPCQIIVELQDPGAVRRMMLAASTAPMAGGRGMNPTVNFFRLEGRDAWICSLSIENIVNIRFGVEIQSDYLVLSNLPWSQKPAFGAAGTAELNTMALDIHPEAGVLQMPGLFTAACEQERKVSVQGQRYLYPLLAGGAGSVAEAVALSWTRFGFAPEHPGKGQWVWADGQIRSTVYGDVRHPVQPEYKPGDRPFGVLAGLDTLNVNLQFEDAGLRVVTRWKMKAP